MKSFEDPERVAPAGGARSLFFLEATFIVGATVLMIAARTDVLSDLASCTASDSGAWLGAVGSWAKWIYYANLATGFVYVTLFGKWWISRPKPWRDSNTTAFSAVAWAGHKAWTTAISETVHMLPALLSSARKRWSVVMQFGLFVVNISSLFALGLVLARCERCMSHWSGGCFSTFGSIAASTLSLILYYDLRVKFDQASISVNRNRWQSHKL